MGEAGAGQLAKMVNQICIAGVLQGLSEGLLFAEAENLDMDKLLSAISGGAAQSWQMVNRGKTMHNREFDFGFAIKWMVKDLGYCIEQAKGNQTNLTFTQEVYDRYINLMDKGPTNWSSQPAELCFTISFHGLIKTSLIPYNVTITPSMHKAIFALNGKPSR